MSMIIDGTNGLTFNNATVQASAGSVLQVVQTSLSTTISTASSTYSDTGLTATITPKFSTSKILVMITLACCGKYSGNTSLALKVLRNGSSILNWDDGFGYNNTTAFIIAQGALNYLDSPATTSATTYKLQYASQANVANAIINDSNGTGASSFMTLMEIAA